MKPAPFEYVRATSLDDAVAALEASGGTAKILAGGQSLVPMLNFRLVDAPLFVDINGLSDLAGIAVAADGGLAVGALTRHRELEISPEIRDRFPVIHEAMKHVAHLAIRNRGTIGGSLSHADPAAELPAMCVLLDAMLDITGPVGVRTVAARDFFHGPLSTDLADDEILTAVAFPALPAGTGWGFEEMAQRHGDFAVAGAAATVSLKDGIVAEARLALFGVDDTPIRADAAETILTGQRPEPDLFDKAAGAARAAVNPMNDLHGSADYRRHLTGVLARRVLKAACGRAA